MAEGFLRAGCGVVGLDARVASVGSWEDGVPADPRAVQVMADRGIDITSHKSRVATPADISAAHLILAMAREHVVAVSARVPDAFARTFTLREFVDRARATGPKPEDVGLGDYLADVGADRRHADMLDNRAELDIDDPIGQSRRVFDRVATEIEELTWVAVDLLAGYPPRA